MMDPQSLLILISLFLLLGYFLFKKNKKHHEDTEPYPILGHLPQFLKNRHRIHDWIAELVACTPTNTVIFRRPVNIRGVITADPANVEHALKSNFDNFPKGPRFHSLLEDFLGDGIFNSDGHLWKVQRKTASFEFNTRSLRNFVVENVRKETETRLIPLLTKNSRSGQVIDIQDVLERYAFDNVCKVAFNVDPACLADDDGLATSTFADAFRDAADLCAGRFRYAVPGFWKVKKLLNIGSERRLQESIAIVHNFAMEIIQSRLKEREISKPQSDDLLSRFITSKEYSDVFLRDIVISFILAGRETTSSALTWFFWLLSSRPDVQQKILAEIASVRTRSGKTNGEPFEFDELREMQYLHAAITESMRLYPPVPINMTFVEKDDVFPDGTQVKQGWFVWYHSYAMGRMEAVWGKDCREFKPIRWIDGDGNFKPESPFKFLVFHAGPRMCLGKEMAYIQMKSIAACVLEKFSLEVVEKKKMPEQMLSLTLRMRGGLAVRVRCRGDDDGMS